MSIILKVSFPAVNDGAEWARDWGSVLVFERLWQELGLRETCRSFGEGRRIRFDIERAAFASVLQRIEKPGADLACSRWLELDVREEILSDPSPFKEVADNLKGKEVLHAGLRHIVGHNPQEAERDRKPRETMVENLQRTLSSRGPKAPVGNRGRQGFLKIDRKRVAIDEKKIKTEARFDGMFVLLTNTGLPSRRGETATHATGPGRSESVMPRNPKGPLCP